MLSFAGFFIPIFLDSQQEAYYQWLCSELLYPERFNEKWNKLFLFQAIEQSIRI